MGDDGARDDNGRGFGDVCDDACSNLRFDPYVVRSRPLLYAYAAALIILSLGLVALILGLAFLCFWYPDKANALLIMLGSPALALIIVQATKIKKLTQRQRDENHKSEGD